MAAVRLVASSASLVRYWTVKQPLWFACMPHEHERAGAGAWDMQRYFRGLRTERLGRSLLYAPVLPSTQDVMLSLDATEGDALACVADQQSEGRGRGGNQWTSPEGCLMVSFRWQTRRADRLTFVQYAVSLCMARAVAAVDQRAGLRLKWPNDLYSPDGLKVGGVLCQSSGQSSRFDVVVGVGINVSNEEPTTCLTKLVGPGPPASDISRETVLSAFFNELEPCLATLERDGFGAFSAAYHGLWLHSGQRVRVQGAEGEATIVGLSESGFLRAALADGTEAELHPDGNSFDFLQGLIVAKRSSRPQM